MGGCRTGRAGEGEGGPELSCMVSCRVVAGLAASSPAAWELLLGTLQCGCRCRTRESRVMEPERAGREGKERGEKGPKSLVLRMAEAALCCFLSTDLILSLFLQFPSLFSEARGSLRRQR